MTVGAVLWPVVTCEAGTQLLIDWQDGSRREWSWYPVEHERRFTRMVDHVRARDAKVTLVPRVSRHVHATGRGCVLWANGNTGDFCRRLRAFQPHPTVVLRHGSPCRQTALWWLSDPLTYDWHKRANERLSFHLKARRCDADPEWLCPVQFASVVWAQPDRQFRARDVVRGLRDAPELRRRHAGV